MAEGAKLASGYIELTVKPGAAMKEISAAITGLGKDAEKAGQQAGDALDKGIGKGAKGAGKTIRDEIAKRAEDAGADAGDAIADGVEKGAKKAGKSVGDELTKATKKAGKEVEKTKIEPKITPKVDKKAAEAELKGLGRSLDGVWAEAGRRAGGAIGAAIRESPMGEWLNDIRDKAQPAFDELRNVGTAVRGIKQHDPAAVLHGVADALGGIGQSDAGSAISSFADTIAARKGEFDALRSTLTDIAGLVGVSGALGPFITAGAAGGVLGVSAGKFITNRMDANERKWYQEHGLDDSNATYNARNSVPVLPMTDAQKAAAGNMILPPAALGPAVPAPAPTDNPLLSLLPKRAGGGIAGVDSKGRLYGPGTGTSDSILAIGADGMPTAKVSNGEGVVKKRAMDNGGAAIVAGLNDGTLPGYDDGTNNVGGPPIPMPQVKVPEATTGQAGQFNSWLSQQQGKAYQYGTLYDCSGFMSQIYNQMTGRQMPRFNTESDLSAYGFVRGSQPGTFQLGIHHGGGGMNSHMAGTLPDGRSVESGGNGVQIGAGAAGAFDPQFEDHWYLPGSAGMGGAPASNGAAGGPGGIAQRTQGYIPAGAGGAGQAGSSLFSGMLRNGASAINGIIDQAAGVAAAGVGAMTFGAGGGAAGAAIGIGTQAAKRGVSYGFQMAGIGADALAEILLPFGVPRFFQTDPTQFVPKLGTSPTGVTTGEKAQLSGAQQAAGQTPNPALNPGGPVQAGQLPGASPVGAPVQMAQATGVASAPVPIGAPAGAPAGRPQLPTDWLVNQQQHPTQTLTPPPGPAPQDDNTLRPTGLGGLLGLAKGGVVGVYDGGGILPAGGIAINASKRPEPVFNHEQWGVLQDNLARTDLGAPDPAAMGGGRDYSVHFHDTVVKDVGEMLREADSRSRLQMMRHAGRP